MGTTLSDVAGVVEAFSPLSLAEPWDRPGLQVGDPESEIQTVLVALDPSSRAVSEAVRQNAQLIVTHHPLFLQPLDRLDLSTTTARLISQLLRSGVGLYCAHTNLDRAKGGVNDALAQQLGLVDIQSFGGGEPLGRLGRLPNALRASEWAKDVAGALGTDSVRFIGDAEGAVQRVAVCGGSGSALWREARDAGADVLVTGDVKYHTALDVRAEAFSLLDVGHGPSEMVAVDVIAAVLRGFAERLSAGVEVMVFREPDPFLTVSR